MIRSIFERSVSPAWHRGPSAVPEQDTYQTSRPVESAGRSMLEDDLMVAQFDGFQAGIDQTSILAGTAFVRPRVLAAVIPSTTKRALSRRATASMTAR